ncbi:hypothetical protein CFN78_01235 [Amycolatopsis antarctica]|uniref:YbaB/EbfC family DNA-binding protein n=1 Tax=Amycolatopsis antarctica TaxID=1854586 RepID=A0A263DBI5_9PSEU|nr:YbaB/EbfC family nucleoid-associated protein [Amycolatopsis antarctica]OZM74867.1 hypothetical protein CFN78_01235 [Amycolatopsis antarctica]
MSAEFERLVAQFERFQSKIQRVDDQFASIGQMQAEIGALEATATSPDRTVTVVAGPGGSVTDIRIADGAMRQDGRALANTLMATLREAVAESARKQAVVVDQHMGGSLGLTEQVLETQAEVLGTSVEELRSKVEQETPRRAVNEGEPEDYSAQSFMARAEDAPAPPPATGGSQGDEFLKNLFDDRGDH